MGEKRKPGRPKLYESPQRIVAQVDAELFERFRLKALTLGRIQRHCVEEAIRDWLDKYSDAGLLNR